MGLVKCENKRIEKYLNWLYEDKEDEILEFVSNVMLFGSANKEALMKKFDDKATQRQQEADYTVGSIPELFEDNYSTMYDAPAEVSVGSTLGDLSNLWDKPVSEWSREELEEEVYDLTDDLEELMETVDEQELDILELEAENAKLRYDLALANRVNYL